jgi:aspartate kinase
MCAVALNAEELQIWKEVDGIFTADPRKIETARLLATITTEEAIELTYYGSEVIHPLTIEQLDGAGVLLRVKNVLNPQGASTIIHPSHNSSPTLGPLAKVEVASVLKESASLARSSSVFMMANGYYGPSQYRRKPTAVTVVSCSIS